MQVLIWNVLLATPQEGGYIKATYRAVFRSVGRSSTQALCEYSMNQVHRSPDRSFAGVQEPQIGEVVLFHLEGAEALEAAKGPRP